MTEPLDRELPPEVQTRLRNWETFRESHRDLQARDFCCDTANEEQVLQSRIDALREMDWLDDLTGSFDDPDEESEPAESQSIRSGELLNDRYRLGQRLSLGGFGEVWEADDVRLARSVAVKLSLRDCLTEAQRVANLSHPGIVAVHDAGKHTDAQGRSWCYIVFELHHRGDLATRLRSGPLAIRDALQIVRATIDPLTAAHTQGVLHRDLKPANILLTDDGSPVLADFGIALTEQELQRETATTSGTVTYMAPELLVDPPTPTVRSDLYSLGVVLFELLAGDPPFRGETLWRLRERILSGTVDCPVDWPDSVTNLLRSLLAFDPDDRPESAVEVGRRIDAILDLLPG